MWGQPPSAVRWSEARLLFSPPTETAGPAPPSGTAEADVPTQNGPDEQNWRKRKEYSLPRLLTIQRRLGAFFQCLAIPDPALARIAGEFEILRKFECVYRTGILAQSAEHAAAQVVGE